jgi:hypothetical protein
MSACSPFSAIGIRQPLDSCAADGRIGCMPRHAAERSGILQSSEGVAADSRIGGGARNPRQVLRFG